MSRNQFVEYERAQIIGSTPIDKGAAENARRWNLAIDTTLGKQRKEWIFVPSSNMTIAFQDLVLSVPHDIGRVILQKRMGRIIERDVPIDAVIDGGIEDAFEAMSLGTAYEAREIAA